MVGFVMISNDSSQEFFRVLSRIPKITHCRDCGGLVEQVNATFSSAETGEAQDITLPYCPRCDVTKPVSTVREPELATVIALSRDRINALMRRIKKLIGDARRGKAA
jgi:hypothetical protein